jgi:hypothetical protein
VPRWARIAAYAVPLAVLPSALWRLLLVLGFSMGTLRDGERVQVHGAESVYIVGLTVVLKALAPLTLGLVRPWGERGPSWIPLLGSRRIAPRPGSSRRWPARARCFWR